MPQQGPSPTQAAQDAILAAPGHVQPGTFELGLVLGGTVSAGAYTAGALDLLVQALDAFQARPPKPAHQVKLRLAAGSSGGAVCAAMLAVSINRAFDPVTGPQAALNAEGAGPVNNIFWNVWVNGLSFLPMLETDDLANAIQDPPPPPDAAAPPVQHVPGLLNSKPIDDAVNTVVAYADQQGPYQFRPWAASPFRIATTVANLRGVPFAISATPSIGSFTGSGYVEHDDFAWFAVPNAEDGGAAGVANRLANEFWLSSTPQPGISVGYQTLAEFARASAALPVGLPARPLSRPAEHYIYRPMALVGADGAVDVFWPQPNWAQLPDVLASDPPTYTFTGVDGGTLNNNPVTIAHDALSGVGVHNPRAAEDSNRALLLIDPLVDQPSPLSGIGVSALAAAKALLGTFLDGSRYLTADLALFQDKNVFSRFQLVPSRTGLDGRAVEGDQAPTDGGAPLVGEAALAGSDFSALAGWFARPLRVHDFLLGRWNMAVYLRRELVLRADNALFDGWSDGERADYALTQSGDRAVVTAATDKTTYFLPIVPMPPDDFGVVLPAWPTGAFVADTLRAPLQNRIEAVLAKLREDNLQGFLGWLAQFVALDGISESITGSLISSLSATLQDRKL